MHNRLLIFFSLLFLCISLMSASEARAIDCTTMAEFDGTDNFTLFSPGKIESDCSDAPLDGYDKRFIEFLKPQNSTCVGVQEINSELIQEFFDLDNPSFFSWFRKMDSKTDIDFFPDGELFPNSCVPFEALTNPNFNLSDYYNSNYAGESQRHPALSRCLAAGLEVATKEDLKACYQMLGHTLPNGDPNLLDGNPMDKLTTPEQQYNEIKLRCKDVIQPCHNKGESNNGELCFNDYGTMRGKGATPFEYCQVLPDEFEDWRRISPDRKAKYLAALNGSKAMGTVYFFIARDKDESDDDVWIDFKAKERNLWAVGKFNVCGAQQTTNNMLDRIRTYTPPEQYEIALGEMNSFVNAGEAYPNIPEDWEYKFSPPITGRQLGINMIIDRINMKCAGPENTEHLPNQYSGGLSISNKKGEGLLGWLKADKDGADSFTEDGEKTEQVYKGFYIFSKNIAYQHAILSRSNFTQLDRYQDKTYKAKAVLVPLPGSDGAGADDQPKEPLQLLCENEIINNILTEICDEYDPDSRTKISGYRPRQHFYGGGPAQIALNQRFKWLQPPEKRAQSECYHEGVIEPNANLLTILKSLFSGGYDNLAGATKCPEEDKSTLASSSTPAEDLGDICAVAEAYNIDCDFFKAVYAVESCSGTYLPTGGELGCCNSIGYCGPMAVGAGIVGTISPDKNRDVCMVESDGMDNFELAARWMLIKKWCNYNAPTCLGSSNPYEWKESYIEDYGNSNITTREEVESFILGWYGSITQIENRVGWPEGSTYVDAVMEYLSSGSLWGGCGYQSPQ